MERNSAPRGYHYSMFKNETFGGYGVALVAHYGSCSKLSASHKNIFNAVDREAAERRQRDQEREAKEATRASIFTAMERGTEPGSEKTEIFGIPLDTMDTAEIRIAAYWLASRLSINHLARESER
jgi:hypothetical protein